MSSSSRCDVAGALVWTAPINVHKSDFRLGSRERWPVWVPDLAIDNAFSLATLGSLPPYCLRARCVHRKGHLAMEFVVQRKHPVTVDSLIRISERFESITGGRYAYRVHLLVVDATDDDLVGGDLPGCQKRNLRVYRGRRDWHGFYNLFFKNVLLEPLRRGTGWRDLASDQQATDQVDRQIELIVDRRSSEYRRVTELPFREGEIFFACAKAGFLSCIVGSLPRSTVAAGFGLIDDDVHFVFQVTDFNQNCVLNIADIEYVLCVENFETVSHSFELKVVDRPMYHQVMACAGYTSLQDGRSSKARDSGWF